MRVGWEPIEKTYTVGQVALAETPVDLRELVVLLESSAFAPRGSSATPELEDPQAAVQLAQIRERLLTTYPVTTELRWADDGSVLLHVSGRLRVLGYRGSFRRGGSGSGNLFGGGMVPR